MEFTYDAYAKLISMLRYYDYQFVSYHNYENSKLCVIMRHDVDTSLEKAVKLSSFERKLGIQSTYFVLVSSPLYNVVTADSIRKLRKIQADGHEIGLHFDELNYDEINYRKFGGVENTIRREVDLLSSILECEIRSVSMHRPSARTLQANYDLGNIVNSYSEEFFSGFKYVSDSRRRWREDVYEIIKSRKYNKLHILTHAFWYNEVEKSIKQSILEFIDDAVIERTMALNQNITDLVEIIK